MRRLGLLLLLLPALALAAPGDKPRYVTVELKSGQQIMGRVLAAECTDDILVVRQIRPPKKTKIPWSNIAPDQARQLRVELGFEAAERAVEALMMKAHRIRNKAGAVFTGLWTNQATAKRDGFFVLKTAEGDRRIRASDVRTGPDEVEVNKLAIYTPLELYEMKLEEHAPETAEDHFRLADFCFAIDALEQAKLHYEKVLEFDDPKYSREKIERNLARVQKLLDQGEARGALKEIKRAVVYKRFAKGRDRIAAFKEKYASEEDLMKEVEQLGEELEKERDRYYVAQVPRLLRDTMKDLFDRKVKDEKELTLRDAMRYATGDPANEDAASRHALDRIAEKLGLTAEEVLKYWNDRPRKNVYKAFYRDGTFIVIDNLEDALSKLRYKGGSKKGAKPPKPSPPKSPDRWWEEKLKTRKYSDLRDWLYAFWAEKSGMSDVLEPKDETCPTCYGKGYTMRMYPTPEGLVPFFNRCQTCYMAKFFRVVRFQ